MTDEIIRCWDTKNPLYLKYHDEEWGVPVHDDQKLFEMLILEGFQAGLTWELILKRRQALKKAFDNFNPDKIANYTPEDLVHILENPEVIRNRLKIQAVVINAQQFSKIREEFGSFDKYIWQFVQSKPIIHKYKNWKEMPAQTQESQNMSNELKKNGFKFVGPTICYAFMQAVGMVNDHLVTCFRHQEINDNRKQ